MRRFRLPLILALATVGAAPAAQAQNFFERLFGITPTRQAPQPAAPAAPAAPEAPAAEAPKPRAAPIQARPVSLRVPTEDGIVGRELKQNGTAGSLKIERITGGPDLRARMTLIGRKGQSPESCSVQLEGKLASEGRVEGLNRYKLSDQDCALSIDVFDDSVLVMGSGESCQFKAANCQADAAGLWGPEPGALLPKAKEYESARASADKAVRENYKALVQRARPESVRPIVAEQAAFSSDREITCRTYAREAQHSFCDARYSEGRAIMLAQRLGVTVASAQPAPGGGTRVRLREQSAAQPVDPAGSPATNEIVERNPFDD